MSQIAMARPDGAEVPEEQWWSVTIMPAAGGGCDAVVVDVVTPLAAQARAWGAKRWFYTRCLDPARSSLQIRILGSPRLLDRLKPFMLALIDQAIPDHGGLQTSDYRENPTRWDCGKLSPKGESDLARYGGTEGLALAEQVFELSSDLAAWATSRFPKVSSRSTLASLLLFDAAHAMMRGPRASAWPDRRMISWKYYWDGHLRGCSAGLNPQELLVNSSLTSQSPQRIRAAQRLMLATAAEPAVDNWRKRWSRAIDNYLYRSEKVRASRSAQHLTFYQSRLMVNRLGIPARDEARLGLYARSWSKELEPGSLERAGS
ncbi:hypothetical protein ITX31_01035 [Arthrobacter gandavensis]|uniref:lantibiotic dehydratase C-terminal domain-containing protein n=1 Tax=Arthrobacter gandavensis TaxID=169960 RepID=UPI00188EAB38|nr:lantibiotic dehydratase C-terminal domain-containing protein [Arthrobacter gandavensis]MBF4992696.1 hypothetical protein [Arthrobacter gandavensis]